MAQCRNCYRELRSGEYTCPCTAGQTPHHPACPCADCRRDQHARNREWERDMAEKMKPGY
jgi:hypothetical protein